jgi:hypothetical protein
MDKGKSCDAVVPTNRSYSEGLAITYQFKFCDCVAEGSGWRTVCSNEMCVVTNCV